MSKHVWLWLSLMGLTACGGGGGGSDGDNNTAPTAQSQALSLDEDTAQSITLTGSDADGDTLSYSVVTQPANGALSGSAPDLTYTPSGDYHGSDSFTFRVNDGTADSSVATVSLTITPINDTLVAQAQVVTLDEDSPAAITLTGSDVDGDTLSYSVMTQPANGTLSGSAPDLTYIPSGDYHGSDSFTFQVNDGVLDSLTATISLTINPINDVPVADELSAQLDQDSSVTITLTGSDAEGDTLSYSVVTQPANGTLTGTAPDLTYTPNGGYSGSDSFTYTVNDGTQDSLAATVSMTINAVATQQLPLNDTGITWGGNYSSGNNTTCIGETVTEQDCSHGRDVTHNDDSDGHAGFSFTKLDASGNALEASAADWSCVKDNVTGLIWEVKVGGNSVVGDEGLHDADDGYNWYNTDPNTNGGADGFADDDGAICYGYDVNNAASYCNTQAYVARVNSAGLCGANDWRLPNKVELRSIANLNRSNPAIDISYFPQTKSRWYWSSSPNADGSDGAWIVDFDFGYAYNGDYRYGSNRVRLVRSGQ